MPHQCPIIHPGVIAQHQGTLRRYRQDHPLQSIDAPAIAQALSYPETSYFITSNLFWDCQSSDGYIRPADMLMCENCGQLREAAPPSPLNEIRDHGIHLDWTAPHALASLEEHSVASRRESSLAAS